MATKSVTVNWILLDKSISNPFPLSVEVPLSLFNGSSQQCRDLFAIQLLDNFNSKVHKSSIVFWKPKKQLSLDTTVNPGWLVSISDLQNSFMRIPLPRSLSEALSGSWIYDKNAVHLIITVDPTALSIPMSRSGSQPPIIQERWTPRSATVDSLYKMLLEVRLVQVRGTPGSGKTTLMDLVHDCILSRDDQAIVEVIKSWPKEESTDIKKRMYSRIKTFSSLGPNSYLLFDNAQDTYWDTLLWDNLFKDTVQHGSGPLAILFCSYGSPAPSPVVYDHGTPPIITDSARISLVPYYSSEPGESRPGLLFSWAEFKDAVGRFKGPDQDLIRVDPELQQELFKWTMGHAGAVGDLLDQLSHVKRQFLRDGGVLTIGHLCDIQLVFSRLPNFSRGLPMDEELQDIGVAAVFRRLLSNGGTMIATSSHDDVHCVEREEYCHRHGWMHSEQHDGEIHFSFSSPLHAMYIASKLTSTSTTKCLFETVRDMAFTIIKKFNPNQLSSPSRIGLAFSERPLEARYQFEFYRGLFAATDGGIRISPELLTTSGAPTNGRIDFFVPGKKWGIELTREGSELREHSARFDSGSKYGVWSTSKDMVDYILLDCRTKSPKLPHPEIQNLFHVVFKDKFRQVTILNNKLETVEGPIALLESPTH